VRSANALALVDVRAQAFDGSSFLRSSIFDRRVTCRARRRDVSSILEQQFNTILPGRPRE
jgi:hypothetical protein